MLTRCHGKITGYAKGAVSKKNFGTYQLGNLIKIDAYARVEDNMLSFRCELVSPLSVNFLSDARKLSTLSALCSLCNVCMPEKENLERFFYYVDSFFNLILEDNWLTHYAYFEFYLLDYLGVGLDLSECSATGVTENLTYISPKSGRAVCREAGEPYKSRLFAYPQFIVDNNYTPELSEITDLLRLTGFFLNKNFFQTHGLKFPQNRASLLENLGI